MPSLFVKFSVVITTLTYIGCLIAGIGLYFFELRPLGEIPPTANVLIAVVALLFAYFGYRVSTRGMKYAFGSADSYEPLLLQFSNPEYNENGLTKEEQRRVEEFEKSLEEMDIDTSDVDTDDIL